MSQKCAICGAAVYTADPQINLDGKLLFSSFTLYGTQRAGFGFFFVLCKGKGDLNATCFLASAALKSNYFFFSGEFDVWWVNESISILSE